LKLCTILFVWLKLSIIKKKTARKLEGVPVHLVHRSGVTWTS
jgi:hypothetical protein